MKYLNAFLLGIIIAFPWSATPIAGQTSPVPVVQQEPTPAFVVEIQSECEVGELVKMSADGDVDGIEWEVMPKTDDFLTFNEGRRAVISARAPGKFLIIVAAARDGKPFLYYQTLVVKGDPTPVSELTAKVGQWLKLIPDGERPKVKQIAGVFRKLAGSETPVEEMLKATALANSAVIGDSIDKWVPFLDKLGTELDGLVAAGKLTTREQYQAVWLEIASALER